MEQSKITVYGAPWCPDCRQSKQFLGEQRVRYNWVDIGEGRNRVQALNDGTIDATEWVGPYNDLAFGLHKAAKYCYYPGWHEPGSVLECMVNKQAFDELPEDLQAIPATKPGS